MKRIVFYLSLVLLAALLTGCSLLKSGKTHLKQYSSLKGFGISGIYADGDQIIVGTSSTGSYNYIFRSTDNGLTWNLADSIHIETSSSHPGIVNFHEVTIAYVSFISDDTCLFAGIGGEYSAGLYISTNDGKTWTKSDSSFVENIHCFTRIGKTVFVGTQDGVFLSTDNGTNWNATDLSDAVTGLTSVKDTLFAASPGNGLFCSINNGISWSKVYTGNFGFEGGIVTTGDNVLVGASSPVGTDTTGGVLVSSDIGKSWTHSNTGLSDNNVNVLNTYGSYIFAGTDSGVYFSKNDGSSWSFLSNGSPRDSLAVFSFSTNNSYLFVGTNDGVWHYPLSQLNN